MAVRTDEETRARALKLWIVLSRSYGAVVRHLHDSLGRAGLTEGEFGVLEALYHKGPLLLGELQRKILVSSGGVTYLVDRLAARGLVRRQACETDRRASYAVLTAEGEALIAEIFPEHAAVIERVLEGLSAKEQERATALLRKLGLSAAAALE